MLLDTLRHWLVRAQVARRSRAGRAQVARMTLETLRLKLLKIEGWVREYRTRVRLRLSSHHPGEGWWHALAGTSPPLMNNPSYLRETSRAGAGHSPV